MQQRLLTQLACLYEYPTAYCAEQCDELMAQLELHHPDAASMLQPFQEFVHSKSLDELEEAFSYTFDLSPVCTLEIGWHLFGEDYRRGQLMAKIRGELAQAGIEETHELPDHLTHVLALLDAMQPADAEFFGTACVIPGLEKMKKGFESKGNAFQELVECTCVLVNSYLEQNCRQMTNG